MLETKVFEVVASVLEVTVSDINKESSAETIDSWDSLKQMNLIMALEQEFDIEFSEEDVFMLLSCEQIIQRVKELKEEKAVL